MHVNSYTLSVQAKDFKMWKQLESVRLDDMNQTAMPPLGLLNYLKDWKTKDDFEIPFVEISNLCVPDWSTWECKPTFSACLFWTLARDGKPARDAQDELEEQMMEQPRTRLEQEAHAAEMAVKARERKEKRSAPRTISYCQWYQYMGTYVTALMIVGCRLTPGYLLSHISVMGQIMEQIALKKNVAQRAAFMVIYLVLV
jgi:hypothetical protein